jgi:hypothetical protein
LAINQDGNVAVGLTEEHVRPIAAKLSRLQWVVAAAVVGFFFGFLDTLIIAAMLGYLGLQVPAYFGVPTTFVGYFMTGLVVGKLAPKEILWEPLIGVLVCVLLFMLGMASVKEQGVLLFILNFLLVPACALGVSYLGLRVARRPLPPKST